MTKQDLTRHEAALKAKRAELGPARDRITEIQISTQADPNETSQTASSVHVAVTNADIDSRMRKDIKWALDRIELGEYGLCLGCGEEISPKRLKAIPWAKLCVDCMKKAENGQPDLTVIVQFG